MKKAIGIAVISVLFSVPFSAGQIFKTSLTLTVRDELGNTVEGASVKLFDTEDDYNKETNQSAEATTNAKGVAKFKGIKPLVYFVLVKKGGKDNAGGGEKIGKLEEGKFNKSTVIIQ